MIISINEMSEIPIYQQIRNQIVRGFPMEGYRRENSFQPSAGLQKRSGSIP